MKHRILVLDDSLTVRMDLAEAFEAAGFETTLGKMASKRGKPCGNRTTPSSWTCCCPTRTAFRSLPGSVATPL